ncbi:MAG: hypothetical protein AB7E51_06685 [Pseudodesulfovibrio sp.]
MLTEILPYLFILLAVFVAWGAVAAWDGIAETRRRRRGQLRFDPRMRS